MDWSTIPPVRATQRPENFLIPPTDPGAYSLCEAIHHVYHEKAPGVPYGVFGLVPTPGFDIDLLFPFGHYYYEFLDLVGRQNIHDLYSQVACYPSN